jgi:ArsR family transcriptional regulator, arsenate/arsenite/antimonite-responsive transcriptional repressor
LIMPPKNGKNSALAPAKLLSDEQMLAEVAGVFKALADPHRLKIFELLMQGDSCNCELNDRLGLPPNLLSHHLRILRQAKLIKSRRDALDGRWIYYVVDREGITRWRAWFHQFFDPARIQTRAALCGPEGQAAMAAATRSLEEAT